MDEKTRIAKELKEQREREKQIKKKMEVKNVLLAKIESSLKQLVAMCEIIDDGNKKKPLQNDQMMLAIGEPLFRFPFPDPGTYDGRLLLEALTPKIQKLMTTVAQAAQRFRDQETDALVSFNNLIAKRVKIIQLSTPEDECKWRKY